MSYYIAITDDSDIDTAYIASCVSAWANGRDISVRIHTFPSAEAFLFTYEEKSDFDILLLDIEMSGMNGVKLAEKIRTKDTRMQIVFITGYPDFIAQGYEVAALHYLMKPVLQEQMDRVLDRAVANLDREKPSVVLHTEGNTFRITVTDIQYIEVFAHSLLVVTAEKSYEVRMSLTQMEQQLGEGFIRCHRSYLVGLHAISHLAKNDVVLDSGKRLPLSRREASRVHRAFVSYYTGELHETV